MTSDLEQKITKETKNGGVLSPTSLTSLASVQIPDKSNGNPTNLTFGRSSVTNYYDEGWLASVVAGSNTMTTFLYDGLGRLRKQLQWSYYSSSTTNGGGGSSSSELAVVPASAPSGGSGSGWQPTGGTCYIYDGMRVIQERSGANNPMVTHTRRQTVSALNGLPRESGTSLTGGGIGGLLARSADYSGGVFSQHDYYHADGQGNITYLADNTQSQAASYAYDPYGNLLSSAGTLAAANTYRFSSREYVPSSGLYVYLYRFYNPATQRWLSQDPMGEGAGVNLYNYVANTPVNRLDLLGLSWWSPIVSWWNILFPNPSQAGSEEAYWANMGQNDANIEQSVNAPDGYINNQRQEIQDMENAVPDVYVFAGGGKEIDGNGGEAMVFIGGNMVNGNSYYGGLIAGQLGIMPNGVDDGWNILGGGGEWTSSDGGTMIGFYDTGFGPGYYFSGDGNGYFLATPTPIFFGIGICWNQY